MALAAGFDFRRVTLAFGDEGVRIAFDCLLKGSIDRGRNTRTPARVQNGSDA